MGPRYWVPVPSLAQDTCSPETTSVYTVWPPMRAFRTIGALFHARFYNVDTPCLKSSALYGAQAGLKELAQVTLKTGSKLREIEK